MGSKPALSHCPSAAHRLCPICQQTVLVLLPAWQANNSTKIVCGRLGKAAEIFGVQAGLCRQAGPGGPGGPSSLNSPRAQLPATSRFAQTVAQASLSAQILRLLAAVLPLVQASMQAAALAQAPNFTPEQQTTLYPGTLSRAANCNHIMSLILRLDDLLAAPGEAWLSALFDVMLPIATFVGFSMTWQQNGEDRVAQCLRIRQRRCHLLIYS